MTQRDLELLETVELKFALAKSDAQVAHLVNVFLVPLLWKLNDAPPVRAKAIGILSHINQRIKGRSEPLPVEDILQAYQQSFANGTASPFMGHFALLYLQMGTDRLTQCNLDLVFHVAQQLSDKPLSQQKALLATLFKVLSAHTELVVDRSLGGSARRWSESDAKYLLERFGQVLFLTDAPSGTSQEVLRQSGLSTDQVRLLTNDGSAAWAMAADRMERLKCALLHFVAPDSYLDQLVTSETATALAPAKFILFATASVDSLYPQVATLGDDLLKRSVVPNWDDPELVTQLYRLYLGSSMPENAAMEEGSPNAPPPLALRIKILGYLNRSQEATNRTANALKVIFDALYGPSNARLRLRGMGFLQWFLRMAPQPALVQVAEPVMTGLGQLVGRPSEENTPLTITDDPLRGSAYEAIGQLGRRVPSLVRQNLELIDRLFDALVHEPPSVSGSVQLALGALASGLQDITAWASEAQVTGLHRILDTNAQQPSYLPRLCALKFAQTLFPPHEVFVRGLALQLAGDDQREIREVARQGLHVALPHTAGKPTLPDPAALLAWLGTRWFPHDADSRQSLIKASALPVLPIPFSNPQAAQALVHFFRRLVLTWSVIISNPDGVGPSTLTLLPKLEHDTLIRDPSLQTVLQASLTQDLVYESNNTQVLPPEVLHGYLVILYNAFHFSQTATVSTDLGAQTLEYLLEMAVFGPLLVSRLLYSALPDLRPKVTSRQLAIRIPAARLTALVAVNCIDEPGQTGDPANLTEWSQSLLNTLTANKLAPDVHHGTVLLLGYLVGRASAATQVLNQPPLIEPLVAQAALDYLQAQLLPTSPALALQGALLAVGEIARYHDLPLSFANGSAGDGLTLPASLITQLGTIAVQSKDPKTLEALYRCAGQIAVGFPELLDPILALFYASPSRHGQLVEAQLAVGEALACAVLGWPSFLMRPGQDLVCLRTRLIQPTWPGTTDANHAVSKVLDRVLMDMTAPDRPPAVPKAAVTWALALVRFGAAHPAVSSRLRDLHAAFAYLLGSKDDLVQEIAASGVGSVFEASDAQLREDLVYALMGFFQDKQTHSSMRVTGDTSIFEASQLGSAPDGSKVTTYQSILSLASDMSRPELVYQLMNLANHHALWNSRRGAAYGFASIMARSREYLQPHLATLIPLLYRYQFDPSKPVQRAMEAIWQALVDDPRVALHDHFDAIFQGLLSHIGHHLWRVREASCMAMAELLQTRGADAAAALTGELEALWQMAFRALDDIKESVGLAGLRLCRVLQTLTLQLCDASATHAREAKPVLATVIPFLLQQGLSSVVAAVKAFSLQMLLQLCNQGGALLQPHAVDLVATLLERLSDIEPQSMNELSFHVDKLGMTTDQLDRMRLNATHMSPVMQATDQCLDQVTSTEAIAALVPKLQHLIRRGMGLATRAGVARALTLLCMKKPHLLRLAPETGPAHASALIKALSGALLEPSAPLRSAWATAIGYLAPLVAKDITIQRLVAHLERLYQEHIDQDVRAIVPTTMLAMSRHALERLQTIGDQVLPLVYFGMRDRDESVRDIWSDVWTDCNGGKTQTATLYQDEILRFNIQVLQESNSWPLQQQAACTLRDLATALGTHTNVVNSGALVVVLDQLKGRVWTGKDKLVECLTALVQANPAAIAASAGKIALIQETILRECRRKDLQYQRAAMEGLGKIVQALKVDWLAVAWSQHLWLGSEEKTNGDHGLIPSAGGTQTRWPAEEDEPLDKPRAIMSAAAKAHTLVQLWAESATATQDAYATRICCQLIAYIMDPIWKVRLAGLEALVPFWERFQGTRGLPDEALSALVEGLVQRASEPRYSIVRIHALQAMRATAVAIKPTDCWSVPVQQRLYAVAKAATQDTNSRVADLATEFLQQHLS